MCKLSSDQTGVSTCFLIVSRVAENVTARILQWRRGIISTLLQKAPHVRPTEHCSFPLDGDDLFEREFYIAAGEENVMTPRISPWAYGTGTALQLNHIDDHNFKTEGTDFTFLVSEFCDGCLERPPCQTSCIPMVVTDNLGSTMSKRCFRLPSVVFDGPAPMKDLNPGGGFWALNVGSQDPLLCCNGTSSILDGISEPHGRACTLTCLCSLDLPSDFLRQNSTHIKHMKSWNPVGNSVSPCCLVGFTVPWADRRYLEAYLPQMECQQTQNSALDMVGVRRQVHLKPQSEIWLPPASSVPESLSPSLEGRQDSSKRLDSDKLSNEDSSPSLSLSFQKPLVNESGYQGFSDWEHLMEVKDPKNMARSFYTQESPQVTVFLDRQDCGGISGLQNDLMASHDQDSRQQLSRSMMCRTNSLSHMSLGATLSVLNMSPFSIVGELTPRPFKEGFVSQPALSNMDAGSNVSLGRTEPSFAPTQTMSATQIEQVEPYSPTLSPKLQLQLPPTETQAGSQSPSVPNHADLVPSLDRTSKAGLSSSLSKDQVFICSGLRGGGKKRKVEDSSVFTARREVYANPPPKTLYAENIYYPRGNRPADTPVPPVAPRSQVNSVQGGFASSSDTAGAQSSPTQTRANKTAPTGLVYVYGPSLRPATIQVGSIVGNTLHAAFGDSLGLDVHALDAYVLCEGRLLPVESPLTLDDIQALLDKSVYIRPRLRGGAPPIRSSEKTFQDKLAKQLAEKGLPAELIPSKIEQVVNTLGPDGLATVFESMEPWRALKKLLAGRVMLIKSQTQGPGPSSAGKPSSNQAAGSTDPWLVSDPWSEGRKNSGPIVKSNPVRSSPTVVPTPWAEAFVMSDGTSHPCIIGKPQHGKCGLVVLTQNK